ncbi:hypothetical protein ABGB12_33390 [Actinocorallia sp. B10E7]|uniref:RICIN domain-containing protein n=1 Tax=Actinocorallia sp. B10E7 TaxID=3153558 RepID=UPI00325C8530
MSTLLAAATFFVSYIASNGDDRKEAEDSRLSLDQTLPSASSSAGSTPPQPSSAPQAAEEPPANGSPTSIENSAYHVIDLYGGQKGYGTMIGAWWSDNDTTSQEWNLRKKGDGYVIEAVREKGVLAYDEEEGGTTLAPEGGANTVWLFKKSADYPGFYSIHSKASDHCITDNDFERGLDPLMGRMLSVEFCGVKPSGAQLWYVGDLDDDGCRDGSAGLDSPLGRVCEER